LDYTQKRGKRFDKTERRNKIADLDFKAQLEDFWYLLEKKIRLGNDYLFKINKEEELDDEH
jgi:hypothetical protein